VRKIAFFVLVINLFPGPAVSGEDGLTLEQAVNLALQQNPEILAAQKDFIISRGRRLQMEAVPDPQIVFSDEGLPLKKNAAGGYDKEYSFGVLQNLEFPGKTVLRGKIGKYGEDIASLDLDRVRLLVKVRVKKAYYKAVCSKRSIEVLEKTSVLLDQFIENLLTKYQAGTALYSDVLRARVDKARLQNRVIEEKKDLKTDLTELNLLLSRKGGDPLDLSTAMVYLPLNKTLAQLKEEALASRPSLKILAAKREQAGAGVRLAKMNHWPDLSLGLFLPSLRAGAWGFSVGISVPLYWWKKQKGEILEAEGLNDQTLISFEQDKRRLLAGIENAYAGVKAAEEQVNIFEQILLKEMEEELKISISYYQYGKIEFFSLLDLYRTFTATKLEHLKSLYLYLTSLADLEIAGEEYAS
jgi:outer membrane protein TolC